MLSIFDSLRGMDMGAILFKMVAACLCGAVIGLERSARNRPAGFRTHILVCMGAAMATTTGLYLLLKLELPSDVSRISGQVISGLGFIGAGTIIVTKKMSIKGLTTAAGLWTTGIIGLAVGSGYYEMGLIGTVLVLIVETWMGSMVGGKIQHNPEYTIEISYYDKNSLDNVMRFCKDQHMTIINLRIQSLETEIALDEEKQPRYTADVSLRGNMACDALLQLINLMPGVLSAVGL